MPIDVDVQAGYKGTPEQEKSLLDRTVADFMRKIKAFYENYRGLQMQRSVVDKYRGADPALGQQYDALMQRGSTIDGSIKRAKEAIDAALGFWGTVKGWFGLSELNQLGAVPVVGVAITAAAAAITLITKWLADVYVFSRKIEELKTLEAAGKITPQRMTEILEKGTGPGLMDMLQRNIIWIVLGGALLMFGPEIMKAVRRMR